MANKRTRAVTREECEELLRVIETGFLMRKPNPAVAMALRLEANLGLRIEDILTLRPSDIIWDYDRYRLDIVEKKTGKLRTFMVPQEIVDFIKKYAEKNGIRPDERLIPLTERMIQKHLALAADYLGLTGIGTHSFRKFFATSIYRDVKDPVLVQTLLQHGSVSTTLRYLNVSSAELEGALKRHIVL